MHSIVRTEPGHEVVADAAGELRDLVRELRRSVTRYTTAGAWSAPGAVTARPAVALPVVRDPEEASRLGIVVPPPDDAPVLRRVSLADIRADLGECTRCKLHGTRNKIVFGNGAEDASLMFVGEAPGADEDRIGDPFVGRAGELLDRMIAAMGWSRETVYVSNVLQCRPPGNRTPEPAEVASCQPFLWAKIGVIRPRVVVALGRPAANTLLGRDAPISALRGRFHDHRGVKVMPTFHPAFLLRNEERKRDAWSDLKMVMAELERLGITPPNRPRA
jgi:DNA polymerase